MTKEERYQATAEQLVQLVGGKENIISAAHCATRLRLVLKDESKANVDEILKTDLVKGQFLDIFRKLSGLHGQKLLIFLRIHNR